MVRMVELIERDYDEAREAGKLSEWGAMRLLDSEELVVVSRESLERMAARLEEAERELDKRLFEESIAHFRSLGYTEDKLLSPEDLVDGASRRASRTETGSKAARPSLLELFAGFFARRPRQAG